MAIDNLHLAAPETASTALRHRDAEGLRQYYVAVDRQQFKMETLADLLEVLGRKDGLPLIICCSSRDGLDAVCAKFSTSQHMSVNCLHSDLAETECALVIEDFQKAINQSLENKVEGNLKREIQEPHSHLLVVTDACLPSQALGEAPLYARVLINYDIPVKKEAYQRRLAACLGHGTIGTLTSAGSIVINMLVGGEIALLKNIEDGCGIIIDEMPIHIFELL